MSKLTKFKGWGIVIFRTFNLLTTNKKAHETFNPDTPCQIQLGCAPYR